MSTCWSQFLFKDFKHINKCTQSIYFKIWIYLKKSKWDITNDMNYLDMKYLNKQNKINFNSIFFLNQNTEKNRLARIKKLRSNGIISRPMYQSYLKTHVKYQCAKNEMLMFLNNAIKLSKRFTKSNPQNQKKLINPDTHKVFLGKRESDDQDNA